MPNPTFANKSVLITGGLGFIGSTLAIALARLGAQVTVVDSLIPEYGGNLYNLPQDTAIRVNISDVRDKYSFKTLVQGQDYLFNLAGQTSHMDSMHDPETDLAINCQAQLSILEACRNHNPTIRVIFASTRQLYGKPDYLPVDEKHPTRPVDVNGINKLAGEGYHLLYSNVYGIRSTILRLTNTYGPRMRIRDARQTFLGIWIRKILEGDSIEVWGGDQLRDFSYVDDVVNAMIQASLADQTIGNIYNIGGDEVISLTDLAKLLVEVNEAGHIEWHTFPEDRKRIDIGDYYSNDSLLRSTIDWKPETDLRTGLAKSLQYFSATLDHYIS